MTPSQKTPQLPADVKIAGIPIDKLVTLVQSFGIPTIFMGVFLVLAWRHVPPVVEGHIMLLQRTGDTLEGMDDTLKQSNAILSEVLKVEQESTAFMQRVAMEHSEHSQKIDRVYNEVTLHEIKDKPRRYGEEKEEGN